MFWFSTFLDFRPENGHNSLKDDSLTFPENVTFIMPGDSLELTVTLNKKSPITLNLKVILREGNLTIGAGVITSLT